MSRVGARRVAAVALVVLVVLAGCNAAGGGSGDAGRAESLAEERGEAEAAGSASGGGDGETGGEAVPQVRDRRVIVTGEVRLTVDRFGAARETLTAAAREAGGFVSDSSRRRHEARGGTYTTGSVTLRVPRDRFDATMARVESVGTVRSSEVRSEDVTDQLVDVEARLANLRAERERLRTLYDGANDTEAVLAVQERLAETQERIERLEARQRTLERQVTYATVRVELSEERPRPGPDEIQRWYDVPLVGAFLESVDGVLVVARAAAVLAAYALPYVLAFGVPPVLVGVLGYRRWRGRTDDADPDETRGDDESE